MVALEAIIGLFEKAPQAFLVLDRAGRVLHANAKAMRDLGLNAWDLPGMGFERLLHGLPPDEARNWFLQTFDRPGLMSQSCTWRREDASDLPVRMSALGLGTETGDRLFIWGQDLSAEQHQLDCLLASASHQRHLAEGIFALAQTRTKAEASQALMDRAAAVLPGLHWFLGGVEPEAFSRMVTPVGWEPLLHDRIGPVLEGLGLLIRESGFAREVFDNRRLCFVEDVLAAPELIHSSPGTASGLRSLLGVPLVFEGRITGTLFGVGIQDEPPVSPDEVQLSILQDLARITALALERIQTAASLEESAGLARNLASAVRELAGAADEAALVDALFAWAAKLAPLPEWWYNHYDPATQTAVTTHWTPGLEAYGTAADIRRPVDVSHSPLLLDMYSGHKGVCIPRCEGHPDLPDWELWPFRTLLGLPLVHEGQVVGSLYGGSFGSQGHILLSNDRFSAMESLAEAAGLVLNRLRNRRDREAEEARFRMLFEQSPDPILLLSEGRIEDANASASRLFGLERSAMIGRLMSAFSPDFQPDGGSSLADCQARMAAALAGEHQGFEWTFLCANGREAICQVNLTRLEHGDQPILHASVRDLTAQKQADLDRAALERQLFQAQKMESLGVLAGGIAHDFNNLLMGVLGHAGLALEQLSPLSPVRRNLESIQKAGQRAADLTRQMLAYSGRGQFVVRHLDLTTQVEEMLHLLEVSLPKTVVLNLDLRKALPAVSADASQIQQVIMNLVINAAEAIGEAPGAITLATGAQQLAASAMEQMLVGQEATPGTFVFLEVTDTGCGMDADTLARIFEPFFTTKFTGRGLGLSAIMGIVRGHKGALQVCSEVGQGTSFKVLFPAMDVCAEPQANQGQEPQWAGNGVILVVDDDETVRAVARQALELKGFEVLEAHDGMVAVQQVKAHPAIGLVLLDMTMPHMGGEETFREMRLIQPDLRVILSSGYNELEAMTRFRGKGLRGFLQKPYGPRELIAKIQGILEA
jgi:PAS domain S-box-containing protein